MTTFPAPATYAGVWLDAMSRSTPGLYRGEDAFWSAMASGFARVMARSDEVMLGNRAAGTIDAEKADLDLYCAQRGPVRRLGGAKARGTAALTRVNTAGGLGVVLAGQEIRVPYAGRSVLATVTSDVQFGSSTLNAIAQVEASTEGTESNAGYVTNGVVFTGQPAPLFDPSITIASINLAGGSPTETDPELRYRQTLWEQGRRFGLAAAVQLAALSVPGVKHVVLANFSQDHTGAAGRVYVGDSEWHFSGTLIADVTRALEEARALGAVSEVRGTQLSLVSIDATISMARSLAYYSEASLRAAITRETLAYFDQRIDPYSYQIAMLAGRISRAHNEIAGVTIASPATSVASPLSLGRLLTDGFPASLVRYGTEAGRIQLTIEGA